MRLGIFSDIHGNKYAFDAVWKELMAESCDRYIFAGDICGYYYQQAEIIDVMMSEKRLLAVKGNHDRAFIEMLNDASLETDYIKKYGTSSSDLKKHISKKQLDYIVNLPEKAEIRDEGVLICHGSPFDPVEGYVYPDSKLEGFDRLEYSVVIMGHTHYPMDKYAGRVHVVNPGSAGQPRDCSTPSWAVIDTVNGRFDLRRTSYDQSGLMRDIDAHNDAVPYLKSVLTRVRDKAL